MHDLSTFPITQKWPASYPDRLQLYSLPTPNGVKVSIMLEETGLPYEAHLVSFESGDQRSEEFLSLNPNNKIPAILDPNGPRTNVRATVTSPKPNACSACWTSAWRVASGSWADATASPTSLHFRGSAAWWSSTKRANWWNSSASSTSSGYWMPSSPGQRWPRG